MSDNLKRYLVILMENRQMGDESIAAGTVLNTILWDGQSAYTPPAGTRLEEEGE